MQRWFLEARNLQEVLLVAVLQHQVRTAGLLELWQVLWRQGRAKSATAVCPSFGSQSFDSCANFGVDDEDDDDW